MTGNQIRELRDELGLSAIEFAGLMGIHLSSVYRWEQSGKTEIRMLPFHEQILIHLEQELERQRSETKRAEWKGTLKKTLIFGGALTALAWVLRRLADDQK